MKARDNPFAVDRVLAVRYAWPEGGESAVLARLRRLRYRAAIVGAHGSGKTTLLEDLEAPLRDLGFTVRRLRLGADHRRFPRGFVSAFSADLGSRDLVCFDGAEQLNMWHWLAFRWRTRRAGGLIITTHRPGRLPTLIECATSVALLDAIVRRLAPAGAELPAASDLFARHRGNLRDALRELYDVFAA